MDELFATATGCSQDFQVSINTTHGTNISMANIETKSHILDLGDLVSIDLGYSDNHQVIFTGYVKNIIHKVMDDTYSIAVYDSLVRAQDYFIASSSPSSPLTYRNIAAETLIGNLLSEAGLTNYSPPTPGTSFTFGVANQFEVNLVSSLDYSRTICDLLTYSLWATKDGEIRMRNRKPFYVSPAMATAFSQPGLSADTPTSYTLVDENVIDIAYSVDEKNLRNRVVVYGAGGSSGEASAVSPYLPVDFYKTALLAAGTLLDDNAICQQVAEYNLNLLNKITEKISTTVVGDPSLEARTVITVNCPSISVSGYFYVYTCAHNFDSGGYITQLELVR